MNARPFGLDMPPKLTKYIYLGHSLVLARGFGDNKQESCEIVMYHSLNSKAIIFENNVYIHDEWQVLFKYYFSIILLKHFVQLLKDESGWLRPFLILSRLAFLFISLSIQ